MSGGGPPKPPPSVLGLPPVPFKKLYTYATGWDKVQIVFACIAAAASGAILPLFSLIFGKTLSILNDPTQNIVEAVSTLSLYFLLIAIGAGGLTFLETSLISRVTEKSLQRLRLAYASRLLSLDAAWFDTHRAGECVTRLSESTITMSTGMEKVPSTIRYSATLICGIAIGFSTSWKLALVIMACAPLFAIALSILIITAISSERAERMAYARAGDAATEVFSLIRAVSAYGGEAHEGKRYAYFLAMAERAGIKKGIGIGSAVGIMLVSFYAMYGISTWAGAQFIIQSREANPICRFQPTTAGCFSGGDVVTTFVATLLGALSFGQIGPLFGNISAARAAAADLFGVIDAVPSVDSAITTGFTGPKVEAGEVVAVEQEKKESTATTTTKAPSRGLTIEFKDVTFAYPSRPDVDILKGFSLSIPAGQNVGFVGQSGSGKSTIALLAMRAYDVQKGSVLVGGVDVKEWNVSALRAVFGLVSQDPVLFGVSVRDNIAMGKIGGAATATDAEVEAAARDANAHSFISTLPEAYNTIAGASVSASQLSGGQRQRICIARALIRRPRVLLLDEATSSLDNTSERAVQAALDAAAGSGGQTTLQIAHRLSTLNKAERIVVLSGGMVVEEGSPAELSAKPDGIFRALKAAQEVSDPGRRKSVGGGDPTSTEESAAAHTSATTTTSSALDGSLVLRKPDTAAKTETSSTVVDISSSSSAKVAAAPAAAAAVASSPRPPTQSVTSRLWQMQKDDWIVFVFGVLGAAGSGCIQPIVSIVYGNIIALYYEPDNAKLEKESLYYLGWFFLLAGGAFVGVMSRVSVFTYLGERLTRRLREASFKAITRQPASFFDNPENSVGRLTTRLATDAALVKGATGDALGSAVEGGGAVIAAIAISFTASWRLALVLMCVFPFLIIGSMFEFRSVAQVSKGGNKALEEASQLISESVTAIRTVSAYSLQTGTVEIYSKALVEPLRAGIRRGLTAAAGQGFQRFMLMAAYSLAFYAGAHFIDSGLLTFPELIRTFLAITLAAEAVGRISSQAPDTAKASNAAEAIFKLIDLGDCSSIDPFSKEGKTVGSSGSSSAAEIEVKTDNASNNHHYKAGLSIEFKDVSFAYPSRPNIKVLDHFSLLVPAGQLAGVVGSSGSGKSTLALLILRAYDVQGGAVLVDGVDVREWNVSALRAAFGLVQQEPALFADSIAYNIGYGLTTQDKFEPGRGVQPKEAGDKSAVEKRGGGDAKKKQDSTTGSADAEKKEEKEEKKEAEVEVEVEVAVKVGKSVDSKVVYPPPPPEVIKAAAAANAATFISKLPDGYATYCGSRGGQLSGGEKQRVAIARALLRSPRALLLDEATAALDSGSEQIVQAALDAVIAESRAAAAVFAKESSEAGSADGGAGGAGGAAGAPPRTTVVIAHRLSTLANADRIVVMDKGRIVEDGNHADLMGRPNGKYRALAMAQQGAAAAAAGAAGH